MAYPQPTQSQESLAEDQLLGQLVSVDKKSEQVQATIAFATKEIAKYTKEMDIMITGILISLLIFVGVELLMTFIKHKTMIQGIDKAHASGWPASGFATALAFEYPALAGWIGFSNKYLPVAAYICFNYMQDITWFQKHTALALNAMAMQAKQGAEGVDAGQLSAMGIICGKVSWGASCTTKVDACKARCPTKGATATDYVSGAMGSITSGIFAGNAMLPGIGGAIGGLVFGGLGAWNAGNKVKEQNDATRQANNCLNA